ncbi:MAG: hypothetical protein K2M12_09620 [Muribaculaceae bacterium]|nr:hypothetical protein [Muribaculaceae bacterium]
MRQFLPEEKNIINYLCNVESISEDIAISNLIEHFCHCSLENIDGTIYLSCNRKRSTSEVINSIMTVICLLDYLQSESLIYIFPRKNVADRKEIINNSENHIKTSDNKLVEHRPIIIGDHIVLRYDNKQIELGETAIAINPLERVPILWDIEILFDRYVNSVFFCTETLKHIKNQDYKDDATVQYECNRCLTWIAIIVSFFVGCAGIYGNFRTYNQSEKHHFESMSQVKQYIIVHDTIPHIVHDTIFQSRVSKQKFEALPLSVRRIDNNLTDTLNGQLVDSININNGNAW